MQFEIIYSSMEKHQQKCQRKARQNVYKKYHGIRFKLKYCHDSIYI